MEGCVGLFRLMQALSAFTGPIVSLAVCKFVFAVTGFLLLCLDGDRFSQKLALIC